MIEHPKIIQGGMGVAISDWKLAQAVSAQGQLGIISGTGVAMIMTARLQKGDPNGHVRRALSNFPDANVAQRILDKYYVDGGTPEGTPFKRMTMWSLNPSQALLETTVAANFVEVFLAKEGHNNPVGINLLEKVQLPNMASLYGAMLAGVDYVIMGAGIPVQIAGILDKLAEHQPVEYRVDVHGASKDDDYRLGFDPEAVFPGISELGTLNRPYFLPIISSNVLAQALLKRSTGKIDGFVIEHHTAGGHNAPPRGAMKLDDNGDPIYSHKDEVNLEKIRDIGLPFWLAGGYGTSEKLQEAIDNGAAGIQVGTAFAYCDESGLTRTLKDRVIDMALKNEIVVRTSPLASPTGFPFKVVQMSGTLAEPAVYEARERVCDIGFLRHLYKEDDKIGFRCPAEPVDQYVKKGGKLEETPGRTCLCNNLSAKAGFANVRRNGYEEPSLMTSGDDLVNLSRYIPEGQTSYTAKDVLQYLTQGILEMA